MCPVCLTTAVTIAAGTGAATGLAALIWGRRPARPTTPPQEKTP